MKITDKMRLDWIQKRRPEICYTFQEFEIRVRHPHDHRHARTSNGYAFRDAIDDAIRADKEVGK